MPDEPDDVTLDEWRELRCELTCGGVLSVTLDQPGGSVSVERRLTEEEIADVLRDGA